MRGLMASWLIIYGVRVVRGCSLFCTLLREICLFAEPVLFRGNRRSRCACFSKGGRGSGDRDGRRAGVPGHVAAIDTLALMGRPVHPLTVL
jgi:hypothetical protein